MGNFREIKFFNGTPESDEFEKVNPGIKGNFDLYKIQRLYLDFDRIVSYRESADREDVTVIDITDEIQYLIPMSYDNFKNYHKSKATN